eukprot:TRINITY_DN3137_c0_g1_i1.p2 TRINITY_DN3137_c0_g1~~TRINITY_DN3137_c0_g1_i1.p2  ORF type:complete len:170 (+),score=65.75 TRINITY_DN3137_c0_g1_i1:171-680(+)
MPMNRAKTLKLAKGFRGRSKNCIRIARQRVEKSLQYSYKDRRRKKREFRSMWIQQINAATRNHGIGYAPFMHAMVGLDIAVDRRVLAQLAQFEPYSFCALTQLAKEYLKEHMPERVAEKRVESKVGKSKLPDISIVDLDGNPVPYNGEELNYDPVAAEEYIRAERAANE